MSDEKFYAERVSIGHGGMKTFTESLECDASTGWLEVTAAEEGRPLVRVLLPAADARRLLAWLRERYPEETTGE